MVKYTVLRTTTGIQSRPGTLEESVLLVMRYLNINRFTRKASEEIKVKKIRVPNKHFSKQFWFIRHIIQHPRTIKQRRNRIFIMLVQTKEVFLWVMAAAKAAENHGDKLSLTATFIEG